MGLSKTGGMTVEVRLAKPEETKQVQNLWNYCFYEEPQYLQWVFGSRYRAENTVVAVEKEQVTGALQLVLSALRLHDKIETCYYIAGVSVLAQSRGKGVASAMMAFAEQVAAERGVSILLLVPALGGYYERFGYVHCTSKEEYVFPVSLAAGYRFNGTTKCVEDATQILPIYETYAGYWDVSIARTQRDMEQIVQCFSAECHGGAYVFYQKCEAVSYLIYHVTPQEINVPECAYKNEAGAHAILQFLGSHSMQTEKVRLRLAPGDPLYTELYQTGVQRIVTPSYMAKKIGCTPVETFDYLGIDAGKRMELLGRQAGNQNNIYINLPQWY